jgi:hypothetical protein
MPVLTEGRRAGEFIVSEANGHRSRDVVILASNGSTPITYPAGHVLALVTASGKYVEYDNVGSDGTETAKAVLYDGVTVPATGDLKAVVIARDAELVKAELSWFTGAVDADKNAAFVDLATVGIIGR